MAIPAFRILWVAQMASNTGSWMQTVGAQWMLVHQPNAAALTSAVQAASLLPTDDPDGNWPHASARLPTASAIQPGSPWPQQPG